MPSRGADRGRRSRRRSPARRRARRASSSTSSQSPSAKATTASGPTLSTTRLPSATSSRRLRRIALSRDHLTAMPGVRAGLAAAMDLHPVEAVVQAAVAAGGRHQARVVGKTGRNHPRPPVGFLARSAAGASRPAGRRTAAGLASPRVDQRVQRREPDLPDLLPAQRRVRSAQRFVPDRRVVEGGDLALPDVEIGEQPGAVGQIGRVGQMRLGQVGGLNDGLEPVARHVVGEAAPAARLLHDLLHPAAGRRIVRRREPLARRKASVPRRPARRPPRRRPRRGSAGRGARPRSPPRAPRHRPGRSRSRNPPPPASGSIAKPGASGGGRRRAPIKRRQGRRSASSAMSAASFQSASSWTRPCCSRTLLNWRSRPEGVARVVPGHSLALT